MTTLNELEALAKDATQGPWMRLFGERTVYDRMNDGCRGVAIVRTDTHPPCGKDVDNLDFIAAANPATILALIALVRQQHEALEGFIGEEEEEYPLTKAAHALAAYEQFGKE